MRTPRIPRAGSSTTTDIGTERPALGERAFLLTCAVLFIATAGRTVSWGRSMSGGMPMPGGWALSMAWIRMPGQTWAGAAASFMAMWVVMMVAMMLPSLVPPLSRYRRSIGGSDGIRLGGLTALVGAGYFCVWALVGAAAYPLGVVLVGAELRWPALARWVPIATGVVLLLAGVVQCTAWKAHYLQYCRECARPLAPDARSAYQHGLRLGVHCSLCCSGFMTLLLVSGMMRLALVAIIAAAIAFERLAAWPGRCARAAGVVVIAAGALVITRALVVA